MMYFRGSFCVRSQLAQQGKDLIVVLVYLNLGHLVSALLHLLVLLKSMFLHEPFTQYCKNWKQSYQWIHDVTESMVCIVCIQ